MALETIMNTDLTVRIITPPSTSFLHKYIYQEPFFVIIPIQKLTVRSLEDTGLWANLLEAGN